MAGLRTNTFKVLGVTVDAIQIPSVIERFHGWIGTRDGSHYVAVTGIGADGIRMQLAWPDVVMWQWRGTVLDWVAATLR